MDSLLKSCLSSSKEPSAVHWQDLDWQIVVGSDQTCLICKLDLCVQLVTSWDAKQLQNFREMFLLVLSMIQPEIGINTSMTFGATRLPSLS